MQAAVLRCPACGAALKVEGSVNLLICEFCENSINIIRPITANSIIEGLGALEETKYRNYLSILEQSMLAGNYTEAYEYCNKGLEINPNAAELWGNKAICSLWLNSDSLYTEEEALEIITYLNACRKNDRGNKIYSEIASSIADNMYNSEMYRYDLLKPDEYVPEAELRYSSRSEWEVAECIKVLQLCYRIHPEIKYLLNALRLLCSGKIEWFSSTGGNSGCAQGLGFDAVKTKEILLREIKKDYTPEKLEFMAKTDYADFTRLANIFPGIDSSFYTRILVPLINKYRPQKPPLSPEERRRRRRNNIIFIGSIIGLLAILYFLVFYLN